MTILPVEIPMKPFKRILKESGILNESRAPLHGDGFPEAPYGIRPARRFRQRWVWMVSRK